MVLLVEYLSSVKKVRNWLPKEIIQVSLVFTFVQMWKETYTLEVGVLSPEKGSGFLLFVLNSFFLNFENHQTKQRIRHVFSQKKG